jgi:hypothetical protein
VFGLDFCPEIRAPIGVNETLSSTRANLRPKPRVHRWSPSSRLSARPHPLWTADRYSAGKKIWQESELLVPSCRRIAAQTPPEQPPSGLLGPRSAPICRLGQKHKKRPQAAAILNREVASPDYSTETSGRLRGVVAVIPHHKLGGLRLRVTCRWLHRRPQPDEPGSPARPTLYGPCPSTACTPAGRSFGPAWPAVQPPGIPCRRTRGI